MRPQLEKSQTFSSMWVAERFNLARHLTNACKALTDTFVFWLLVAVFAIAEPFLCAIKPEGIIFKVQVVVLFISSVLYGIQLVGVATREWDTIDRLQRENGVFDMREMKAVKLMIFFTAEGEYMFEFACLAAGWALIFVNPGLAALRCFRVYRLLWFYEVTVFRATAEKIFNPLFGEDFVNRVFSILKFAIKALTALVDEMFRLGNKTRGGIILMLLFFYSAFVVGIVVWVETGAENVLCTNIGECTFVLMRLTFYDGDGFDFAFFLTKDHKILFCIVMFYMALTAFGILNGLVGIFGNVFANASESVFGEVDGDGEGQEEDADDNVSEISSIDIGDLPGSRGNDKNNFVIEQTSKGGNVLRRGHSDADRKKESSESFNSFGESLRVSDGFLNSFPDPLRTSIPEMQNVSFVEDEEGSSDDEADGLSVIPSIGPSVGPALPRTVPMSTMKDARLKQPTAGSRKATYADLQKLHKQSKAQNKAPKKPNWLTAANKARSFKAAAVSPGGTPILKENETSAKYSPVKKPVANTIFSISKNLRANRESEEVANLREDVRTLVQMQTTMQQQLALLIQMNSNGHVNTGMDSCTAHAGTPLSGSGSFHSAREKKGGGGVPSGGEGGRLSMLSNMLHPGHSRVHVTAPQEGTSEYSLQAIRETDEKLSKPRNHGNAGRAAHKDDAVPFDESVQNE